MPGLSGVTKSVGGSDSAIQFSDFVPFRCIASLAQAKRFSQANKGHEDNFTLLKKDLLYVYEINDVRIFNALT